MSLTFLVIAIYLAGAIAMTIIITGLSRRSGREVVDSDSFYIGFAGLVWPIIVGLVVIFGSMYLIGKLGMIIWR